MFNPKFKSNWLKIIASNSNIQILDDPSRIKEVVRIPLTPVNIDAYLLYYLFEILYPKFVNDQQNILDIIISDDNKEILRIYLFETQKAGIHQSYQKISNEIIGLQEGDLKNIEEFFNKIQIAIVKNKGVRISTIRVFKQEAINLINQYCDSLENLATFNFIPRLLGLLEELLENDLFFIYPYPNFINFVKGNITLLNGIKISEIIKIFHSLLPNLNISILFTNSKQPFILKTHTEKLRSKESNSFISLFTSERLGIDMKNLQIPDMLDIIKKTVESDKVYSLYQNDAIALLLDLFELEFPIKLDKLQLIFQKILFGVRNFENKWYMTPRPQVYNSFFRFILRLFRFNLNLKKLSHWAISEFIFHSFYSNFGLNSKTLIIITSIDKKNFNKVEYIKYDFRYAFLFEIENRKLVKIISIKKQELLSEHKINTLDVIRAKLSEKYGYISAVINIDKFLLHELISNFSSNLAKFKLFSKFKGFNLFKKEYYFNMYPKIPPFKYIKEKGMNNFFKIVLPVLIDKHEF